MRVESTVTTVSWIPSEAVTGMTKLPFEIGAMHYDDPPPDHIDDLEPLRAAGRFRFANRLAAWIDVEDGRITGHGYAGGGMMGLTRLSLGAPVTFAPIGLPDIQREPVVEHDRVRFTQTAGGRPAIPAPRHVNHPPFVQLKGPTVWTTLELVINADGSSTLELVGASRFPRHWVYDNDGRLVAKAGLADFKDWYRHAFGKHTPWGGEDSQAIRTDGRIPARTRAVDDDHARRSQARAPEGAQGPDARRTGGRGRRRVPTPQWRALCRGRRRSAGRTRARRHRRRARILERGRRTSTLRALTDCKVAVVRGDQLARDALAELSKDHRREEP